MQAKSNNTLRMPDGINMSTLSTTTKKSDWYEFATRNNHALELQRRKAVMSAAWGSFPVGVDEPRMLRKILETVRSIVRNHGAPRECKIDFATLKEQTAGCAGFKDAPDSFEEPFILIDKSPIKFCEHAELLDVYCGIGIHEASHILFTRERILRLAAGMSKRRTLYDNLWEDERIEALARKQSPGYAPFLQATKHALIERPLAITALRWEDLPDMDKIEKLLFAFIRCPHEITEEMKSWQAINDECVFDYVRACFLAAPESEVDVGDFAERTETIWHEFRQLYPDLPNQFNREREVGGIDDDSVDRVIRQLEADAMDRAKLLADDDHYQNVADNLLDEAIRFDTSAGSALRSDRPLLLEVSERLFELARAVKKSGDSEHGRKGRRFGYPEVKCIIDSRERIRCPITEAEMVAISALDDEDRDFDERSNLAFGDEWDWNGDRRTIIQFAKASEDAHKKHVLDQIAVRRHVDSLRCSIRVVESPVNTILNGRRRGRVNGRQLAKASIDDRIFYQRTEESDKGGMALCLLLDESGSMFSGAPSRFDRARQVATLFVDALGTAPNIEVEVYTHCSTGDDERDCLLRYCYGRRNSSAASMCEPVGGCNYDHQAIQSAAKLFRENTTQPSRWMIVVSDGAPSGDNYGGEPAVAATRDAVIHIRKSGIRVLNVAIEDYASEEIFGSSWVLKYTNLDDFVLQMKRLVTRLVRAAF